MALTIITPKNAVVDRTANTTIRWTTTLSFSDITEYDFQYRLKTAGSWSSTGRTAAPSNFSRLVIKFDDLGLIDGYEYYYRLILYYQATDSAGIIYTAREVSLPCSIVVHSRRIGRLRIKVGYGDVETVPLYENTNNTNLKNRIKISDTAIGNENISANVPELNSRLKTRNDRNTRIAISETPISDFYYNTSMNGSVYVVYRQSSKYYVPATYGYKYNYSPAGTYYSYKTSSSYSYITGYHASGQYTCYSTETGTSSYDVPHSQSYSYNVYHTYNIPYQYSPSSGHYATAYYTKSEYAYHVSGQYTWYTTYTYNYTYYASHTGTQYAADYAYQWIYAYKQNYYSYQYNYTKTYAHYAYNYSYSSYAYTYHG